MKAKPLILIVFTIFFSHQLFAEIFEVNNNEIISLMGNGVPLIDIRTEMEWNQTGIIENSKLLTFFDKNGNFDTDDWMAKLGKIAVQREPLIIICRSGRRSRIVANYLNLKANYKIIYHATHGINSWIDTKNKTVKPPE